MIPKRRDNKEEEGHQARAVKGKGMLRKLSDLSYSLSLCLSISLSLYLSLSIYLSIYLSISLSFFLNICNVLVEDLLLKTA